MQLNHPSKIQVCLKLLDSSGDLEGDMGDLVTVSFPPFSNL